MSAPAVTSGVSARQEAVLDKVSGNIVSLRGRREGLRYTQLMFTRQGLRRLIVFPAQLILCPTV